jgi:hypothetical protein
MTAQNQERTWWPLLSAAACLPSSLDMDCNMVMLATGCGMFASASKPGNENEKYKYVILKSTLICRAHRFVYALHQEDQG